MITPFKILKYLSACAAILLLIAAVVPEKGIVLSGGYTIQFKTIKELTSFEFIEKQKLAEERRQKAARIEAIKNAKTKSLHDTIAMLCALQNESPTGFKVSDNERSFFTRLFTALDQTKTAKKKFRIIHYGDSQIEMDRITGNIREQLQRMFGGKGPGLVPALQLTPSYSISQQTGGNWKRYLSFGSKDFRAGHSKYGPMTYFCAFDSGYASVSYSPRNKKKYPTTSRFETVKVIVGPSENKFSVVLQYNGKNKEEKIFEPAQTEQYAEWSLDSSNHNFTLRFNGWKGMVQGVSIESKTGVIVDNIPMRGASGTTFTSIDFSNLKRSYEKLGVKMLILQFGGNMLPYIDNETKAANYGNSFYKQLEYLKKTIPGLMVMVIGPADMGINVKGNIETHPFLEKTRDALKAATLKAGGVYWDMYESMGGKGSMLKWVKATPPLGSPDYIHFSTKGAEKISGLFWESLMKEYEIYKLRIKAEGIKK